MIDILIHLLAGGPSLVSIAAELYTSIGRLTPLVFTLVPSGLALILFAVLRKSRATGVKWLPYIPLLIGVILGILGWIAISSSLFTQMQTLGTKSHIIYRAVLIAPILTAIGIFLVDRFGERKADLNL